MDASIASPAPGKALGVSLVSVAVDPKNAAPAVSGAETIDTATNDVPAQVITALVFTALASIGVAYPFLVRAFSGVGSGSRCRIPINASG
ncbi:hypothetical protein [Rhodococcus sp. 27YEA15]|uniref:hypothetical protein n=1 Tax=Rhodococcus sp. 27YEA15 TaxID=3156259 RepID=UPI003C7BFF71